VVSTEETSGSLCCDFGAYDGCNVSITDESVQVKTDDKPRRILHKLNLRDIDPESVKLRLLDSQALFSSDCNASQPTKQVNCDLGMIDFSTRNGDPAISVDQRLGNVSPDSPWMVSKTRGWLRADDVPYAKKLTLAFRHAAELCGGTPSKF
jgi:hypothetical protein